MAVPQTKFSMDCIFIHYLFDEYFKQWEAGSEDRQQSFYFLIQEFEFGGLTFKSRPGFPTAKAKVCGSISAFTPFSHVKQNV